MNTTRRERRRGRGEQGDTLIELLFAMGILAVAITVIVASMATAITMSTRHREQARAATMLVTAAENIKRADYVPCTGSTTPSYPTGLTPDPRWTVSSSVVQTLDAKGVPTNCPALDTKLQQVTVAVTTPSGYKAATQVVKRCKGPDLDHCNA